MTVPSAVFRFLATDSHTRLLAKPQLRGAEGEELTLEIGEEVPIPRTTFGGVAAGGINTVPIQSFDYRPIGIIVKMKPRVTFENEVVLDISVENSTLLGNLTVAGQELPSFGSRKVKTRMRLREGESNLLAGLLREDERRTLRGFPGLLRVPILKDLLGNSQRHDPLDRRGDAADAAHRAHARTDAGAPQSDSHRLAVECRLDRPVAGDCRAAGSSSRPRPARSDRSRLRRGGIPPAPQPVAPVGTTSTPGLPPAQPAPQTSTPGQQPPPQTTLRHPHRRRVRRRRPTIRRRRRRARRALARRQARARRPAGTPPAGTPPPRRRLRRRRRRRIAGARRAAGGCAGGRAVRRAAAGGARADRRHHARP